jgi:hypothetical protein
MINQYYHANCIVATHVLTIITISNDHYLIKCLHYLGQGLTLKILRRTQECGNELQELKPVDQNLQYDFNYQQFTYLPEEITVMPVCAAYEWML